MKTYQKLALIAALTAPLAASAQLISSGTLIDIYNNTGSFHDTVIAMNSDASALNSIGNPADSNDPNNLTLRSPIHFLRTGTNTGTWGDDYSNDVNALNFFNVATFEAFKITGSFDIGFVAEESGDGNTLRVTSYADNTLAPAVDYKTLFTWNKGTTTPPPVSRTVAGGSLQDPVYISFSHYNTNPSIIPPEQFQIDSDRWRIYQAGVRDETGAVTYSNEWLFTIGDRNDNFDGDYDDGVFYLTGDITAVPEPSQIAALAMLGLAGALLIRRRIKK